MVELYIDGTFLICPSLFHQFFVILARRNDYVLPVFYCLLPNKTEDTYRFFFYFPSNPKNIEGHSHSSEESGPISIRMQYRWTLNWLYIMLLGLSFLNHTLGAVSFTSFKTSRNICLPPICSLFIIPIQSFQFMLK